jgi:putative DNA primase/helicase
MTATHDLAEIKRAIALFYKPDDVVEIRAPKTQQKTLSGYFDDHKKLAEAAASISGKSPGTYVVMNEVRTELLARSANRVTPYAETTTADSDIVRRRWLLGDFDAVRPAGISASDAEHGSAIAKAQECAAYLVTLGFPEDSIIIADSGNGGHVLVRTDLPNDATSTALIQSCLRALDSKFSDAQVKVDLTTYNSARIWKLPGTLAAKGDSTPDRPYRIARIITAPAALVVAPRAALEALAATLPVESRKAPAAARGLPVQPFDVESWLVEHGIEVKTTSPYEGGTRSILKCCVFNREHVGTSAAIIQGPDGRIGYKCHHNSCCDKTWHDVRELLEPGYKTRRQGIGEPSRDGFHLTDTGNAELFGQLYGDQLRYDHRRHRWLLWRQGRWQPDVDGQVARLSVEASRARYEQAGQIEDLRERQRVASWAITSESKMRLEASIAIARSVLPMADRGDSWDRNPWLLGVVNGVVDLKMGELRRGHPDDRITMSTGVEFDPDAECPRWEQFLNEVFGDDELIVWLWRALGYSISGDTTEQCIFIGHGRGANGKTKFSEAIRAALGDYSYSSPFSTFELYQRAAIPNDLAALEFKRFVTSSETNDNTRLNEARIKAISGGDPITARYLHAEYFTFMPHLKLWLFVNHKPKVEDDSHGFWRRVRLIPFIRQFSGEAQDKKLGETLRAEAPGILSWLVRGCLEWQERGLDPVPEVVKVATREYREESDRLAGFISDRCAEHANATIKASDLYNEYKNWAVEQGMREKEILTSTAFGRRMRDKFSKEKRGGTVYYFGIGLPGQLQDSFVSSIAENDVFPICDASRVKHRTTILNCPDEAKTGQNCPAIGDNHLENILGMPVEKALDVWRSEGAPVIHLGPGENCEDLEKLLSNSDCLERHLEIVKQWLTDNQRRNRERSK